MAETDVQTSVLQICSQRWLFGGGGGGGGTIPFFPKIAFFLYLS